MTARRPRVAIVQERLPHYRLPFFDQLRVRLAADEIDLSVVHGRGNSVMASRGDEADLPWAHVVDNRVVHAGGTKLIWQPVLGMTAGVDLVIVEQASRMAANYALLARQACGGPPVAFWGHGANLQSDRSWRNRVAEAAKARVSRMPHWWFAYTEGSARRVEALGFPAHRVTVVQNAVDTSLIEATARRRDPYRCIFVGSLVPAKRLDLVFAASDLVAKQIPEFSLVIVGDGEERGRVQQAAASRPYVAYRGARMGRELASELKASSVMLMPAHVGLGVLEAFAAGVPVVTAEDMAHSPEFEYLLDRVNASIGEATPESLSSRLVGLLRDPVALSGLRAGCATSSSNFTMSEMVSRFANGVVGGLGRQVELP